MITFSTDFLSSLSKGSEEDKILWSFKFYDINKDGIISRDEMIKVTVATQTSQVSSLTHCVVGDIPQKIFISQYIRFYFDLVPILNDLEAIFCQNLISVGMFLLYLCTGCN